MEAGGPDQCDEYDADRKDDPWGDVAGAGVRWRCGVRDRQWVSGCGGESLNRGEREGAESGAGPRTWEAGEGGSLGGAATPGVVEAKAVGHDDEQWAVVDGESSWPRNLA